MEWHDVEGDDAGDGVHLKVLFRVQFFGLDSPGDRVGRR